MDSGFSFCRFLQRVEYAMIDTYLREVGRHICLDDQTHYTSLKRFLLHVYVHIQAQGACIIWNKTPPENLWF